MAIQKFGRLDLRAPVFHNSFGPDLGLHTPEATVVSALVHFIHRQPKHLTISNVTDHCAVLNLEFGTPGLLSLRFMSQLCFSRRLPERSPPSNAVDHGYRPIREFWSSGFQSSCNLSSPDLGLLDYTICRHRTSGSVGQINTQAPSTTSSTTCARTSSAQ